MVLLAAAVLTSCAPTPPAVTELGTGKDDPTSVAIELTTEGLNYNGVQLNLDDSMSEWIDVLGPARESKTNGTMVWDDLGIRVRSRSIDDDRVNYVGISLLRRPTYRAQSSSLSSQPLKLYMGRLFLEGIAIEKNTTIRDLRGEVYKKSLRIYCTKGTGVCAVSHDPPRKSASNYIAFNADTRLDNSPIYEASVAKWFERSPQDPSQSTLPEIN